MSVSNLSNSVWSILDVLLYPALYLLFTPFLIHHLGKDAYGLFIMVNTIVVLMQIFNFGIGINTQKNVASAIGKSAFGEIPFIINAKISVAMLISLLCILLTLVFAQCIFRFHWFDIPVLLRHTALVSVGLSGIIVAQKMIEQVLVNTFIAFEKIGLVARYNSIVRLCNLFFTMFLVKTGADLYLIFCATICIYFLGLGLLYFFLIRETGTFRIRFFREWAFMKKELQYSKWVWLQSVLVILTFQFDKFLVAFWFGIGKFSYYSIVSTVFNHIHLALMAIAPWALPQIAKRVSGGAEIKDYYISFRSLIHIIAFLGIMTLSLLHRQIFTLWLGKDMLHTIEPYLHLFMIFEMMLSLTIAPYFLLNAMGREKQAAVNTLIYCSFSMFGLLIGYCIFRSIEAIIAGTTIALFLSMVVQQIIIGKMLSLNLFKEVVLILLPFISLSFFILSEGQPLLVRSLLFVMSLSSLVYSYYIKYPVLFIHINAAIKPDPLLTSGSID